MIILYQSYRKHTFYDITSAWRPCTNVTRARNYEINNGYTPCDDSDDGRFLSCCNHPQYDAENIVRTENGLIRNSVFFFKKKNLPNDSDGCVAPRKRIQRPARGLEASTCTYRRRPRAHRVQYRDALDLSSNRRHTNVKQRVRWQRRSRADR